MLMPIALAKSLQFSTCFYILSLGTILVSLLSKKYDFNKIWMIFLYMGILTAFFDFLTYPIATLGIPLLVYLSSIDSDEKNKYIIMIKSAFSWGIGYVGMWASKWILASIFTKENVIENAMIAIKGRSSNLSPSGEQYMVINVLLDNLKKFLYTPFSLIFIVFLIYYYMRNKKYNIKEINWHEIINPYFVMAIVPFLWYIFATNHSAIHSWFTNKTLVITVFSLMIGIQEAYIKCQKIQGEK